MRIAGIAAALALASSLAAAAQTPHPGHTSGSHPSSSGRTYRTSPPTYHTAAPTYHTMPTYHTAPPTYHTAPPTYRTAPPMYRTAPPTYRTMPPVHHTASPIFHTTAPAYHTAPPLHPGTTHSTRTSYGSVHMRSSSWVHGVTSYHSSRYHTTIQVTFAAHPTRYPHARWAYSNGRRWWDGYWYNYWSDQDWMWWNGHYGFWLDYDGIAIFVYEYSPGVCYFWNGYGWAPWYDPPWTPYYCPY